MAYPLVRSKATPTKRLMFDKSKRKWSYKIVNGKNYYDKGSKLNKGGNQGMWKVESAPKLKGAFGDEDPNNKTIRINKSLSKRAWKFKGNATKKFGMSHKDTSIINSIYHEEDHRKHPRMREKNIRKLAHKQVARAGKKAKGRMYRLVK